MTIKDLDNECTGKNEDTTEFTEADLLKALVDTIERFEKNYGAQAKFVVIGVYDGGTSIVATPMSPTEASNILADAFAKTIDVIVTIEEQSKGLAN